MVVDQVLNSSSSFPMLLQAEFASDFIVEKKETRIYKSEKNKRKKNKVL